MFDVFYISKPTGLFAHEQRADSVEHARELSRTRYLWIIDSHNDYSSFDWLWEPKPWESHQAHVWPSQHQANGGTWLIPKNGHSDINRVHPIVSRKMPVPIIGIDHGDGLSVECTIKTRYISDYLGTLRRVLSKIDEEYVWVISSVCDYSTFDFTWHPSEWQQDMLHVFPSDGQKFGDTFYVHVPSFLEKSQNLALLEWFETLHFVEDRSVPRRALPVIRHDMDTHVDAVKSVDMIGPLALFVSGSAEIRSIPTVSLWREETKTIVPLTASGDISLIPKSALSHIQTQLYDYKWIDKTQKSLYPSRLQDIVFISYDEPQADDNWQKLKSKFPRAIRVHGVSGMENALVAAAEASNTPWYFAVFAKTELADEFEFDYVPDYLQQAKHYVFDCENTVNGLRYGHMGIVMYNCAMVKQGRSYDQELGLDYTLSFPHEVVPILSCYGRFDSSPYHTWRTAFREASKLAYFNAVDPSVDTEYRLHIWTTRATGQYAEWCLRGATDGVEFFKESQTDLSYLKKGFRWEWLRKRFVDRWGDLD